MKATKSLGWIGGVFGFVSTQLIAPVSMGQEAPQAEFQLEEIVVTAQKRQEDLQKTSVAVTAITGDTLRALGVASAMDLTQVVPNLTVSQTGPAVQVAIRGVVNNNITEVGNPAVAFNLDGVYLARQRSASMGMYDIERVEVLRGPQGTLYGRNATAGSINVITNKPSLVEPSSTASVAFGNYDAFTTNGAFNMPLSDTVGFRAAFNVDRHAGYVETAPNNRDFDDLDTKGGRVHLLWEPSENFSALLTYDFGHNGGAGRGGFGNGAPLGDYAVSAGATPYEYQTKIGPTWLDQTVKSQTLTVNWSLPLLDVTYVGNHRTDDWATVIAQAVNGPITNRCPTASSPSCQGNSSDSQDQQISHELRFSKETDRLKWVVGLYYFKEDNNIFNGIEPSNPAAPTGSLAFDMPSVRERTQAAFSQATWSLTDRLRLTGGLRYTKDNKGRDGANMVGTAGVSIVNFECVGCTVTGINHADLDWTNTSWRAGIDFDLSPDSLLFASVATGYKAGGYGDGAAPNNFPSEPETLTNYELGWKNQLLNNRLQINVDAFLTKYQNYQSTAGVTLPNGQTAAVTLNAGEAEIKGVELESTFLLTPYDRVNFNATWLDAKFTQFFLANGDQFSPGGVNFTPYDLTGNKLPFAPDTTFRLGYQHTFPLASGGELVARVDSGYVAKQFMEFHNFRVLSQDAYTRTGLSLTWDASEKFSTQLFVRNLEDKAVLAAASSDNNAPGRRFNDFGRQAFYMAPRTYGIRFTSSF